MNALGSRFPAGLSDVSGSKRGRSVWLAVILAITAALTITACQDGYPIEATACDRYCDLRRAPGCGGDNPAGCVVNCEVYWGWTRYGCAEEFEAAVSCHKQHQHHLLCDDSFVSQMEGCETPQQALNDCERALSVPQSPVSPE